MSTHPNPCEFNTTDIGENETSVTILRDNKTIARIEQEDCRTGGIVELLSEVTDDSNVTVDVTRLHEFTPRCRITAIANLASYPGWGYRMFDGPPQSELLDVVIPSVAERFGSIAERTETIRFLAEIIAIRHSDQMKIVSHSVAKLLATNKLKG